MTNGLVSIIVPIYNAALFLDECINSLLRQTYMNIEILLINDGSTDNSQGICQKYADYDPRVKYLYQENSGVSVARNKGIESATGDYIVFVDADDYVDSSYVEEIVSALIINNADCVQCGYKKFNNTSIKNELRGNSFCIKGKEIVEGLLKSQGYGRTWCMIYKRKLIGDERFNPSLSLGEDAEFNLRVLDKADKLFYLDKALYFYRVNANSTVKRYDELYCDKYKKTSIEILNHCKNKTERLHIAQEFICYIVVQVIINYACNIKAFPSFFDRTRRIEDVCNVKEFEYAIYNADISKNMFSFFVFINLLKIRQYWIVAILCSLKNSR